MTDALVVDLNRSTHHAIEPASESFETDGPFVVRIRNHGEGSHVHCSISGDLATAATVTEDNPFLGPDEAVEIPVDVRTDLRPARGTLELSTGYGRESVEIDVLVREAATVPTSPISREPAEGAAASSGDSSGPTANLATGDLPIAMDGIAERVRVALPRGDAGTAVLALLALLAIAGALLAWQVIEGPVVFLAVLVVLATVFGAAIALLRTSIAERGS